LAIVFGAVGAFVLMWASEFKAVILPEPNTSKWGFAYPEKVPANDAGERVEDFVQVCGTVTQEVHDSDLVFLSVGGQHPSHEFAFWGDRFSIYGTFKRTERDLEGKFVCGRGSIALYRGDPQIHIERGDLRRDFRFTPVSLLVLIGASLLAAYIMVFADQSGPRG
jgi:hypothetical protein